MDAVIQLWYSTAMTTEQRFCTRQAVSRALGLEPKPATSPRIAEAVRGRLLRPGGKKPQHRCGLQLSSRGRGTTMRVCQQLHADRSSLHFGWTAGCQHDPLLPGPHPQAAPQRL